MLTYQWFLMFRETEYEDEFELFLRGGETVLAGKPPKIDGLSPEQVSGLPFLPSSAHSRSKTMTITV